MPAILKPLRPKQPSPTRVARSLYGEAFDTDRADDLSASISDWASLTNAERSFSIAHLLYLNLQAQGRTSYQLGKVREQLAVLSRDLGDVLDELGGPELLEDADPSDVPEPEELLLDGSEDDGAAE